MGHHEVETLRVTRSHRRVVGMLGVGAGMAGLPGVSETDLDAIADAMLEASLQGFDRAKSDTGLIYTFFLLTQITQAARQGQHFERALTEIGVTSPTAALRASIPSVQLTATDSIYDLVANFTNAVDRRLARTGDRTDLGEIAQHAAAQSLTILCEDHARTLFGSGAETVRDSLRELSTKRGFARLAKDFFGRWTSGFLIYHLSKELSNHVGPGRRFASVTEHNAFLRDMEAHCSTAASVLAEFSGTWYSKHNFEGGITEQKAFGFVGHALDKVSDALRHLGGSHVA